MELGDNAINANYQELFYPSTGTSNKENIFYIQYLENYLGTGLPQHALSAKDGDGAWSIRLLIYTNRMNLRMELLSAMMIRDMTRLI